MICRFSKRSELATNGTLQRQEMWFKYQQSQWYHRYGQIPKISPSFFSFLHLLSACCVPEIQRQIRHNAWPRWASSPVEKQQRRENKTALWHFIWVSMICARSFVCKMVQSEGSLKKWTQSQMLVLQSTSEILWSSPFCFLEEELETWEGQMAWESRGWSRERKPCLLVSVLFSHIDPWSGHSTYNFKILFVYFILAALLRYDRHTKSHTYFMYNNWWVWR